MNYYRVEILKFIAKNLMRFLAVVLFVTSCSSLENYYGEFRTMPSEGWHYNSPLEFLPDLRHSQMTGDLSVAIRHTNRYPYSNIYIEVSIQDTVETRCDTFNIVLADRYGRWQGKGIGTSFQHSDTLYHNLTLHRPVKIKLRHIMRNDILPEVEQIGISFDK